MTTTEAEELAVVQRGLDNLPQPAMDQLPKGSAVRQLAEALGRPHLARRVTELLGQHVSVVLAQAVADVVVRRTTEIERKVEARISAEYAARFAAELEQAHAAIVDRWTEPDCVSPEPESKPAAEPEKDYVGEWLQDTGGSLPDRPAELWANRVDLHQPPSVLVQVFDRALGEAVEQAAQARVDRFMADR